MELLGIIIYVSLWISLIVLLYLYFRKDVKIIKVVDDTEVQELKMVCYDLKCLNRKYRHQIKDLEMKSCDNLDQIDKLKEQLEDVYLAQRKYKGIK